MAAGITNAALKGGLEIIGKVHAGKNPQVLAETQKVFRIEKLPFEINAKQVEYRNSGIDLKAKLNEKLLQAKTKETSLSRRNLDSHEGVSGVQEGKQIGHTRLKHIGKSERWLQNRIRNEGIPSASSFHNYEVGNRTIGKFKKQYEAEINQWLKNKDTTPFEGVIDMKEDIGLVVNSNKKGTPLAAEKATKATVRLVKDNSEFGWHLFTVKLQK